MFFRRMFADRHQKEEHDRKDLGMISNGLCRLQKYGDTTCNSHLNWRIMINLKIVDDFEVYFQRNLAVEAGVAAGALLQLIPGSWQVWCPPG